MAATATLNEAISLLDTIIDRLRPSGRTSVEPASAPASSENVVPKQEKAAALNTPSTSVPSISEKVPSNGPDLTEDFDKAHLQVGCVVSVEDHPVAEKLYVCKVEVSKGEVRQVVAGLRKFISSSDLLGKKVCLVLNLKPAKLAGQLSEAMILAGDSTSSDGSISVKVLEPPANSAIGDRIFLEGSVPSEKPVKQLSSKIWEKLVQVLSVQGGIAKLGCTSLVTSSGVVTVPGLPDGASIH